MHLYMQIAMEDIYTEFPYLDCGAAAISLAVKIGSSKGVHADVTDYLGALAWIIPFGSFTGANLKVAQLGQVIELKEGDALGIVARLLAHASTPLDGHRAIFTLFLENTFAVASRGFWRAVGFTTKI